MIVFERAGGVEGRVIKSKEITNSLGNDKLFRCAGVPIKKRPGENVRRRRKRGIVLLGMQ